MNKNISNRQSEIIQAAINLIGEGGIQALTIKNLSSKIGVTESAIYRHFSSRNEILEKLLDSLKRVISVRFTKIAQSKKSSLEKIKEIVSSQFETFSANPSYAIVILSDGLYKNEEVLHNRIYAIMELAKATFLNIIEDGKKSGEIRRDIPSDQMAFIIMGSARLMVNQWSLSGFKFDLKEKGKSLYDTICLLIQNK